MLVPSSAAGSIPWDTQGTADRTARDLSPSPSLHGTNFGTTKIQNYIFILEGHWGRSREKKKAAPNTGPYSSGSFLFHRVKEDFEEIKVVWKNPGVVALHVVMGGRDEV